jgi:hypothetical protein
MGGSAIECGGTRRGGCRDGHGRAASIEGSSSDDDEDSHGRGAADGGVASSAGAGCAWYWAVMLGSEGHG